MTPMTSCQPFRATKIICTIGPATESPEKLRELMKAGANVFRLNMSHSSADWVREISLRIRHLAAELRVNVATLFDLQGPSIRTGDLDTPYDLKPGDRIEFRIGDAAPGLDYSTTVNYEGLVEDVHAGDTMVVDNGGLLMRILEVRPDRVVCEAMTEGRFGSRRHINLPGVALRLPALTDKDLNDLETAISCDADYIAMSFVRSADHIRELRAHIERLGGQARIMAKIEDRQAVSHIDSIILAADVIMVARGDLGIEVNIEELPVIQRHIITQCLRLGRRCVVATHMLESMITQPTPTRAEVTDVSNAIYEQFDAVTLSGETTVGHFPERCVEVLDLIARRMETTESLNLAGNAVLDGDRQKIIRSAVGLADSVEEACLIIFTRRGTTAIQASLLRPANSPIYAFSNDPASVRHLALARGVQAFETNFFRDPEQMLANAFDILKQRCLVRDGQPVVIMGDSLQGELLADSIIFMRV